MDVAAAERSIELIPEQMVEIGALNQMEWRDLGNMLHYYQPKNVDKVIDQHRAKRVHLEEFTWLYTTIKPCKL